MKVPRPELARRIPATRGERESHRCGIGSFGAFVLLVLLVSACDQPEVREATAADGHAAGSGPAEGVEAAYQRAFAGGSMEIAEIEIGRRVGRNMRIADPAERFEPGDPVFVVAITEGGEPGARLAARWRATDGDLLGAESEWVPPGRQYVEFGVPGRQAGPPGGYTVEFFLDGELAGSIDFEVLDKIEPEGLLERWGGNARSGSDRSGNARSGSAPSGGVR